MPVMDERRVAAMVEYLVSDPSAASRPFNSVDAKFSIATDDEFVEAFDRVVSLLRELLALERIELAVKPVAERTPPRRRRTPPPAQLPLFGNKQPPVSREPGPGFSTSVKRRRG